MRAAVVPVLALRALNGTNVILKEDEGRWRGRWSPSVVVGVAIMLSNSEIDRCATP